MKKSKRMAKRAGAAVLAAILAMSGTMCQQTEPVFAASGYSLSASSEDNGLIADPNQDGLIPDAESDNGLIPDEYPDDVIVPRTDDDNEVDAHFTDTDANVYSEQENTLPGEAIDDSGYNYDGFERNLDNTGLSSEYENNYPDQDENTDSKDDSQDGITNKYATDGNTAGQEDSEPIESVSSSTHLYNGDASVNGASADWYKDYSYTIDNENRTITIKYYNRSTSENEIIVPGSTDINGISYKTVLTGGVFRYKSKIESIVIQSGCEATNCKEMFRGCERLTNLDISGLDTTNATNMYGMFHECYKLTTLDVSGFKTSNVTNMRYMFDGCRVLTTLDVSGFDTSNVTDMFSMFDCCYSLTALDVSGFDTSNVTDMRYMFYSCKKLTTLDISKFDTKNVLNMESMFKFCESLSTLNVGKLDTKNVTSMGNMFEHCSSLTALDVSGLDTSNVTNMDGMFESCSSLQSLNVSGLDTSNVTDMGQMFWGCSNLKSIDVGGFDTENVTRMYSMFSDCTDLVTLDVSRFNTKNVIIMDDMFCGCSSLTTLNVSKFDTKNVTSMSYMFRDCSSLTSLDVSGFDTKNVTDMGCMFYGCSNLAELDISGFDMSGVNTNDYDASYIFYNCDALTVSLPESWKYYNYAFRSDDEHIGVRVVYYPLTMSEWESLGYKLDDDVTVICSDGTYMKSPVMSKTTATMTRAGQTYNLFTENQEFDLESIEIVSITITPFWDNHSKGMIRLTQDGKTVLESKTGVLSSTIAPSSLFSVGKKVYLEIYDSQNHLIGKRNIKIQIVDTLALDSVILEYNGDFNVCMDMLKDKYALYDTDGEFTLTCKAKNSEEEMSYWISVDGINTITEGNSTGVFTLNTASFKNASSIYVITSNGTEVKSTKIKLKILKPVISTTGKLKHTEENGSGTGEIDFSINEEEFFTTATKYNHEIAKYACGLSLMAYNIEENTPKERERINILFSYLGYDSYFDYGENNNDAIFFYKDDDGKTATFWITKKLLHRDTTLVTVTIRGTDGKEWFDNFDSGTGDVHLGFRKGADKVEEALSEYLDKYDISDSNVKLLITGHSRGAAVANLIGRDINTTPNKSPIGNHSFNKEDVFVYTFATPNVSKNVVDNADNNVFNILNPEDFVTKVLPSEWGYGRWGRDLIFPSISNTEYFKYDSIYKQVRSNWVKYWGEDSRNDMIYEHYPRGMQNVNDYVHDITSVVPTIEEYYTKKFFNLKAVIGNKKTLYQLFYDTLATYMAGNKDVGLSNFLDAFAGVYGKLGQNTASYFIWYQKIDPYFAYGHCAETYLSFMKTISEEELLRKKESYRISLNSVGLLAPGSGGIVQIEIDGEGNGTSASIYLSPTTTDDTTSTTVDTYNKTIIIPCEGNHSIRITGNGTGKMDYSIEKIDSDTMRGERVYYHDIPVETGITYVESFDEGVALENLTLEDTQGNVVAEPVLITEENSNKLSVEVAVEGSGYASSLYNLTPGDYASLEATATEDSLFDGWYSEAGELQSSEATYGFSVSKNERLIARFKYNSEYSFTVRFAGTANDPYSGLYYNTDNQHYEIAYTGSAITPNIIVNGVKGRLKEGIDYTVKYANNTKCDKTGKPATVTVTGKGNYTGKTVLQFYILRADLGVAKEKGLVTVADEIRIQKGKKASPAVYYRGTALKTADMTVSNKNAINEDTTISISGAGNYTGTIEDIRVKIISAADSKAYAIKIALKAGTHTYTGEPQTLTCATPESAGELTVTAGTSKTPLIYGTDYEVQYSSNINAGTAKFTVTGKGQYNGSVSKTFKILPDKTSPVTVETVEPEVSYDPAGAMPAINVYIQRPGGEPLTLVSGKDYSVTYSNNKSVGTGKIAVKFLGNYNGHAAVNKSFTIGRVPFAGAEVTVCDMTYTKPGKYISAPTVAVDGIKLNTKDYTVKYYDGSKEVTASTKISLDNDEQSKVITVKVRGAGSYSSDQVTTSYRIIRPVGTVTDLSKAKIYAKEKSNGKDVAVGKQEYTGRPVTPEIRVMIKNGKVWEEVPSSSYTVTYVNNTAKGKATIIVNGNGTDTVGSKTANFTINAMKLDLFSWLFG